MSHEITTLSITHQGFTRFVAQRGEVSILLRGVDGGAIDAAATRAFERADAGDVVTMSRHFDGAWTAFEPGRLF
jgi:hypothetical protein